MNLDDKIYVAGHRGLVGSAILRALERGGFTQVVVRTHAELDLTDRAAVDAFFARERPSHGILAAARVGGIVANATYPADFIRDNLAIELNVIDAAHRFGCGRLLFLGSSCIYPRDCPQPIREEYLLTGPLETTNSAYAVAKIAGIEMARAYRRQYGDRFIAVMPTNLYGPGDNYDLQTSHVLPALIRKLVEAKQAGAPTMTVWGTGRPRREFLHADDLADACLFLLEHYDGDQILNIGTGRDCTIAELAAMVAAAVGYTGELVFDPTQPDGTPQKLLDVRRLTALGWQAKISLCDGINRTVAEYLEQGGG
ncbi:MAG: GDP-L-fucose synthase [Deltaproteobacteria bacterium]|nr:GDP-L-fucose synthase [Deltaproteobacteria bacterium]OIP66823.1 MAG: GDP-fucose synthetase [Nitrospirae bacterium CG2_30_70_394]PIU77377.1 MAG: GDP-fucose synthetase [Nitrospirae bacterium CG06_land_8_20_14_3_00_70_43]PIW82416.1 MAG: GDP-fucose synthetase [Nitrospirae bacterium CG_4_8_14_3_um_filter_70_85]PIX84466.1 MAG: GDP-fucose synthetase [Nitrospirae bacterium CG_4_10_14_3_um_filter_70_108]PJB94716.1 MAG: GDP-fucose synthetase [Nitrospirae bacterium CG_4_9_14_0_8_um_filter_70_14]